MNSHKLLLKLFATIAIFLWLTSVVILIGTLGWTFVAVLLLRIGAISLLAIIGGEDIQ